MVFQGAGGAGSPAVTGDRRRNANHTRSAAMAVNPRAAAKAKGYIDSVMSLTRTKLLPHVPEITSRLIHSAGVDTSFIRLSQLNVRWREEGPVYPRLMLRLPATKAGTCPRAKAFHCR